MSESWQAGDESGRYDILETTTSGAMNASGQVVKADPSCVMIAFASNVGTPLSLSTKSPAVINTGIQLPPNTTFSIIVLDLATFGRLVQVDWFAIATAAWTVTALQLFLRRPPKRDVLDFWSAFNADQNGQQSEADPVGGNIDRMARAIAAETRSYFQSAADQSLLNQLRRARSLGTGDHNGSGSSAVDTPVQRIGGLDQATSEWYFRRRRPDSGVLRDYRGSLSGSGWDMGRSAPE
jgi:hypothetical protein